MPAKKKVRPIVKCFNCGKEFPFDPSAGSGKFCKRECYRTWTSTPHHFWNMVDIKGPDECWDWKGGANKQGYGKVWYKGSDARSPRIAYELTFGPIPDGLIVCHTCDRPICCAPHHLFLGTHKDNARDCVSKGRRANGERCNLTKLTESKVKEIRARWAAGGITQLEMCKDYGVTNTCISDIVNRKNWKHI